jgi:hypothetical protein
MKGRYLEVTFRRGKPLAAYLYLPRSAGAKVARTTAAGKGLKVDFDATDAPMGVEITAPPAVSMADVNAILAQLGAIALSIVPARRALMMLLMCTLLVSCGPYTRVQHQGETDAGQPIYRITCDKEKMERCYDKARKVCNNRYRKTKSRRGAMTIVCEGEGKGSLAEGSERSASTFSAPPSTLMMERAARIDAAAPTGREERCDYFADLFAGEKDAPASSRLRLEKRANESCDAGKAELRGKPIDEVVTQPED